MLWVWGPLIQVKNIAKFAFFHIISDIIIMISMGCYTVMFIYYIYK